MKKEAVKKWWKEHEVGDVIIGIVTFAGCLGFGYWAGGKITGLKTDLGLRYCETNGYLKFFNPETGQQLTPNEFCQLKIK